MKTRLTELLGVEHPVMLAGMGGVSYARPGRRGVGGRRLRLPRRLDHEHRPHGRRDGRRAGRHRPAVRRRPAHRHARRPGRAGGAASSRAGPRSSWPAWACRPRSSSSATPRPAGGQHVRQGRPRPAGPRRRVRHGGGPGHRGRRPHRPGGHPAPGAPDRGRRGRRHPGGGGRRHLRRTRASPPPSPSGPTGCGWAPGSSPPPRPGASPATRTPCSRRRRTAPSSAGPSRARPCGCCATGTRTFFEDHPDELQPFPAQLGRSMQDGAWHLGRRLQDTPGSTPTREGYPTGQGVGAIHVARCRRPTWCAAIVAEAEQVLARIGTPGRALTGGASPRGRGGPVAHAGARAPTGRPARRPGDDRAVGAGGVPAHGVGVEPACRPARHGRRSTP